VDTSDEERAKGKTVECGKAHFETEKKRYTVLDAPGHKLFVPNMINGAAQADVGVLVIAARKGEFETGFEKGGQTREHAQLAKTLGVSKLVVVVNKMDDPSCNWAQERFDEVVTKLTPFLKQCGYNTKKDVTFLPVSGLHGFGIKDRVTLERCPWYGGPSLFEVLDNLEPQDRNKDAPFRMPILDKHKDMGTMIMGKTEAGTVMRGDDMMLMPNKVPIKVQAIYRDEDEVPYALPGENIRLRVSGVDEESVSTGFVVCSASQPGRSVKVFEAQVAVTELLEHKALFTAGYKAIMHCHTLTEECEVTKLIGQIDPKTKELMKGKKCTFVKAGSIVMCRIAVEQPILIEKFSDYPQLGRFTLRDEGKTIAIGKVTELPKKKVAETVSAPVPT
jgi:peptide chain release factor subunit 3